MGFNPATDKSILKPAQTRDWQYLDDVFKKYSFGHVSFCDTQNCLQNLDTINPIFVIIFDSIEAEKVKSHKADCFVYVFDSYRKILRNKTIEKEQEKYTELEGLVKKFGEKDDEKIIRKVSAMGYKETYATVKEMLVSDKPELKKQAWELLNQKHGDWPWMRANLMVDCWEGSDAKSKERLIMMGIKRHVKAGTAVQIDDLIDGEVVCRQYKMHDGTVYRVPVAADGVDKLTYESILEKLNSGPC